MNYFKLNEFCWVDSMLRLLNTYTRKFVLMWPTDFYDLPVSVFFILC